MLFVGVSFDSKHFCEAALCDSVHYVELDGGILSFEDSYVVQHFIGERLVWKNVVTSIKNFALKNTLQNSLRVIHYFFFFKYLQYLLLDVPWEPV